VPSHATDLLDVGLCYKCTRVERDNAALDAREATIRADERAKTEAEIVALCSEVDALRAQVAKVEAEIVAWLHSHTPPAIGGHRR